MPTFVVQSEAAIHATVNGVALPTVKSWSSFAGGDAQSASSQLLPGGMQPALAMPGPIKRTNVTVKRPYTAALHNLVPTLEAAINGAMSASYTPTDANGNPVAGRITRTGLLKEVQVPDFDAEADKNA